jgi:hypothetical protein
MHPYSKTPLPIPIPKPFPYDVNLRLGVTEISTVWLLNGPKPIKEAKDTCTELNTCNTHLK